MIFIQAYNKHILYYNKNNGKSVKEFLKLSYNIGKAMYTENAVCRNPNLRSLYKLSNKGLFTNEISPCSRIWVWSR